jgi:hypothetical protein
MCEYLKKIDGKYDLEQIELQIAGEEAGASEFVSSVISLDETPVMNIVAFKALSGGIVPKKLTLVIDGDDPPDDAEEVWSGPMIVEGTNEYVYAYRAN